MFVLRLVSPYESPFRNRSQNRQLLPRASDFAPYRSQIRRNFWLFSGSVTDSIPFRNFWSKSFVVKNSAGNVVIVVEMRVFPSRMPLLIDVETDSTALIILFESNKPSARLQWKTDTVRTPYILHE